MSEIRYQKEREQFGMKVKLFRIQRKLTQQALGEAAGTDGQQIGRIERGTVGVSIDRVFAIADALGLRSAAMLFEFDDMLD